MVNFKLRGFFLFFVLILFLGGCSFFLQQREYKTYRNELAGFEVEVPADWDVLKATPFSSSLASVDGRVVFNSRLELGGVDYPTSEQLAQDIKQEYRRLITGLKLVEQGASQVEKDAYRLIFKGKLAGKPVMTKIFILSPAPGIRYYLTFFTPEKDFLSNDYTFEDVAKSFSRTSVDQELYQKFKHE